MQILEQFYTIIVIACLLLLMSFRDILTSRLLRWVIILLLYSESIRIIVETGAQETSIWVLMTGYLARSLFIPTAYLYLRNHFEKRQLARPDVINLLPCAIFCVGCGIAYLANGNLNFLVNTDSNHIFSPFSGEQFALLCFKLFVYCLTGFYLWLVLLMLKKNYRSAEKDKELVSIKVNGNGHGNGFNGNGSVNGNANGNGHHGHEVKKNGEVAPFFLTEEKMKHIDGVVKDFLSEKKPFLQHGYSLKHLSDEVHIPLHHLSAFINRYYKMNFNDFINEYRVSHCKVKIINEEWKYKKLEAIAGESGFSNRNTFTSAFKKATGLNPSVFLKQIKEEQRHDHDVLVLNGNGSDLEKASSMTSKEAEDL